MPYDVITARRMVRTAEMMERSPSGEFILEIGKMLKAADAEIAGAAEQIRSAQVEARRYQTDADDARLEVKRIKEGIGRPLEIAKTALKQIADGAKGGRKIATAALHDMAPPEAAERDGASMFPRSESPIFNDRIGLAPEETK